MSSYEIKVYKIYFDECDDFYIGSTKTALSNRMTQHRAAVRKGSNYRVHNFIRSKDLIFNYILVRTCVVFNKDQQRQFEQLVISEMNPNLNKIRAYRTEEQKREYYSENKEQIKLYQKENKGKIKEYQKEYRDENKEQLKEYHKEYNKEYYSENKGQMKEHQKEYQKEYRNENKESISEKGKIKIHCPYCDKYTRRSDISKHIKTKNHIKNLYFYYHNFINS